MLTAFRPGRVTAACLGLALGTGGPLFGADIFCTDKCQKDLHHDRGTTRAITPNTIFVPRDAAPTPQMMGFITTMPTGGRDLSTNGLERALEAEYHAIQAESARAAFRAEVEGKQRLLQKLGSLDTTTQTNNSISAELKTRLDALDASMKSLSARLSDVERLMIVHDNYLQELSKNLPPNKPLTVPGPLLAGPPPGAPPAPMPPEPKPK